MGEDDERINACTSRERMGEEDALVELHAMVARVSFVSVTLLGVSKQRVARLRLSPVFSLIQLTSILALTDGAATTSTTLPVWGMTVSSLLCPRTRRGPTLACSIVAFHTALLYRIALGSAWGHGGKNLFIAHCDGNLSHRRSDAPHQGRVSCRRRARGGAACGLGKG